MAMLNETWKDQHARLLRSQRRLQDALARQSERGGDLDAIDALYHFCCDALHLRDWVKNDPQCQQDASALFQNPSVLSDCRDIANRSKHFELWSRPYTPAEVGARSAVVFAPTA